MRFRTRLLLIFTAAIVASVAVVDLLVLGSTRQAFERRNRNAPRPWSCSFATSSTAAAANWSAPSTPSRHRTRCATSPFSRTPANTTITPLRRRPLTIWICWNWCPPMAPSSAALSGRRASATKRSGSPPAKTGSSAAHSCGARNCRRASRSPWWPSRIATEGDRRLYVVGGQQLDREFLSTLVLPAGMRVMLYRNLDAHFTPSELIDATGPAPGSASCAL